MKIGAIIQARSSSTRLPKKVLKTLPCNSDVTVLQNVIRRVKKTHLIDTVIVATTDALIDRVIVDIAEKEQVKCFCGSEDDVLARYYYAAQKFELDVIVRITSDCPCIDWNIIDRIIKEITEKRNDFSHTSQSYPRGVGDIEVMTYKTLKTAYENASEKHEREHVTPYIYKSHSKKFKITQLDAETEFFHPEIRVTLDTQEDYILLCAIFDYLYANDNFFTTKDIINLLENRPWMSLINSKIAQKKFTDLNGEIEQALNVLELQDLKKAKDYLAAQWNS